MDESEPAKHPSAERVSVELGDHETPLAADNHPGRLAGAIKHDSDLPADINGEFKQMAGEIEGQNFAGRYPTAVESLESLELTWFEAEQIAVKLFYRKFLSAGAIHEVLLQADYVVATVDKMNLTGYPAG